MGVHAVTQHSQSWKSHLNSEMHVLTHWSRVMHICVGNLTSIASDNGLSPGRRQAIIATNDGILLIRTSGTNVSENLSEIHTFSFKEIDSKMSSGKCRPFCLGLNVLISKHPPLNWLTINDSEAPIQRTRLCSWQWKCVFGLWTLVYHVSNLLSLIQIIALEYTACTFQTLSPHIFTVSL